jgi:type I restriction enzyme S subunit
MRDGWVAMSLSEVVEYTIGGVWGGESGTDEVEVTVVRSTEFTKRGFLNFETGVPRSIKSSQLKSRELKPGDILLEKSGGGPDQPVGRVVFVTEAIPEKFVCSNFVQLVRPNSEQIEPLLLFHIMWQWHAINRTLEFQAQTTGIRNLRTPDYLEQEINLPPIPEQKRIVDLISSVDSYIRALQQQLESAKNFKSAYVNTIVTEVLAKGKKTKIADISEVKGGKRLPKGTPWSEEPTDHRYIRATDIKDGVILTENLVYVPDDVWPVISRYVVNQGDVVITIAGTIGQVGVIPDSLDGVNLTENAAKIVVDRKLVRSNYLGMLLGSSYYQQDIDSKTKKTTQPKLGLNMINSIEIPLPELAEQDEIFSVVSQINTLISSTNNLIMQTITLRTGLLSDLLSGVHEIPASYDKVIGAA